MLIQKKAKVPKRILTTSLIISLIFGLNLSPVFAINESNPNLEYVRAGVEIYNYVEQNIDNASIYDDTGRLNVKIKAKKVVGKKVTKGSDKFSQIELDSFDGKQSTSKLFEYVFRYKTYYTDGVGGTGSTIRNSSGQSTYFDFYYLMTINEAEDVAKARQEAETIARSIATKTSDPKEQVRLANKYVTEKTVYKDGNPENKEDMKLWSASGVLIYGEAICEGYCAAFKQILDELGITTLTIHGIGKNREETGNHAWSKVKIDGKWYYCDVTWNDPVGGRENEEWLLLSEEEFYRDGKHVIEPMEEKIGDNMYHTIYRNDQLYEAGVLKNAGLFMGDSRGFRLEDGLTRAEMAAVLTRAVGGNTEVEQNKELYAAKCEFTDVPDWAKPYVGYCVTKGMVKGIGNGLYGSLNQASKLDFCTVILRTKGINCEYLTSDMTAVQMGYINEGRTAFPDLNRADVVHVLYNLNK